MPLYENIYRLVLCKAYEVRIWRASDSIPAFSGDIPSDIADVAKRIPELVDRERNRAAHFKLIVDQFAKLSGVTAVEVIHPPGGRGLVYHLAPVQKPGHRELSE